MPDMEKVIKGLEQCISPNWTCSGCPYEGTVCTTTLDADALALLKEQNEVIDALLKVGYPHNFQREEPWIVNYMYAITDVIKQAVHLRNGGD